MNEVQIAMVISAAVMPIQARGAFTDMGAFGRREAPEVGILNIFFETTVASVFLLL